jgi:hypothetical protein
LINAKAKDSIFHDSDDEEDADLEHIALTASRCFRLLIRTCQFRQDAPHPNTAICLPT